MTSKHYVSVIVPTYHDWERLKLCMDALFVQTYPSDFYEVIIVNNDPNDKPVQLFLPENFKLIEEGKPGSYAARNAALLIAKGNIIAFTDSDCIPDPNWLKSSLVKLDKGAKRVAGKVELFFQSEKLTISELYEKAFAFDQKSNVKKGTSVTANMITWKESFSSVGNFDDSLMSGGDIEWGERAHIKGIPIVYASDVIVKHPARESIKAMLQKRRRLAGGKVNVKASQNKRSIVMLLLRGYFPLARVLIKLL